MTQSRVIRFGMGLILSAALVLGFSQFSLPAQAAEVDFLPEDFGEATGLGTDTSLEETIGSIINAALGFLGIIAVVIILYGGFKWMTAGGNDEKVTEARKLIIAGIIGLAIILSAYAIASFVIDELAGATGIG